MTADCQVPLPGIEASTVNLSAIKDGVPASVVELNRIGFGHISIPACIVQLPESGLMHYGSVGFFFGTNGGLLAKKPDRTFVTYDMQKSPPPVTHWWRGTLIIHRCYLIISVTFSFVLAPV
ncbi:hypothetical protein AXL64_21525, partial [Salmonella enterica subsp. enterica]|nr:hypothetical protein [Salmonella enterica subsp. enterica]